MPRSTTQGLLYLSLLQKKLTLLIPYKQTSRNHPFWRTFRVTISSILTLIPLKRKEQVLWYTILRAILRQVIILNGARLSLSYSLSRRRCITCKCQMNKHQIRRIDSYIQLLWRLKRIAKELNRNTAAVKSIQGCWGGYTIY